MSLTHRLLALAAFALTCGGAPAAEYPERPIRLSIATMKVAKIKADQA